jgi:cytochrome c biogenesis protein CcmG/thiol:disulfide interchange protein DsbE
MDALSAVRRDGLKEPGANGPAAAAPARRVALWIQLLVWGALLALLALVGVGLQRAQQGTVQPGETIPDFELAFFTGYEYDHRPTVALSDLRGKVVLINFWASWCKPCEQEAAALEGAWEYYERTGQVVFLGIDYVDTEPAARVFMKKFGNTYPNGPDTGTRLAQMFRIKGVPETFIVDVEGVLRYVKIGPFSSAEEIIAAIDPLLPSASAGRP